MLRLSVFLLFVPYSIDSKATVFTKLFPALWASVNYILEPVQYKWYPHTTVAPENKQYALVKHQHYKFRYSQSRLDITSVFSKKSRRNNYESGRRAKSPGTPYLLNFRTEVNRHDGELKKWKEKEK